jgi:hypothetical protein
VSISNWWQQPVPARIIWTRFCLFAYTVDEAALTRTELNDGKLLLVTNTADLDPAEVIARYKSLADIERGSRVIKSVIDVAPVFHRLPRHRQRPNQTEPRAARLVRATSTRGPHQRALQHRPVVPISIA